MTDKASEGQAGPPTAAAAEGLIGGWCRGFAVFPHLPFVLEDGPARVFEGGESLVGGVTPCIAVCSYRHQGTSSECL